MTRNAMSSKETKTDRAQTRRSLSYWNDGVCLPASRVEAVLNLRVLDDRNPVL